MSYPKGLVYKNLPNGNQNKIYIYECSEEELAEFCGLASYGDLVPRDYTKNWSWSIEKDSYYVISKTDIKWFKLDLLRGMMDVRK